MVESVEA